MKPEILIPKEEIADELVAHLRQGILEQKVVLMHRDTTWIERFIFLMNLHLKAKDD